jgi:hypothetical protein
MPRCSAAGLDFRIIPAGFNAPLEFLTGFTFLIPNSISSQVHTDSFIEDFKGNRYEKIIYPVRKPRCLQRG